MSAKIIRSELMKSINQTMMVVFIIERSYDQPDIYRVLFADAFGNVQMKREFCNKNTMQEFVAEQMSLEHDWRCANPQA